MDFLLIFAVAFLMLLSFVGGWIAREMAASRRIDQLMAQVEENVEEQVREQLIPIKIEHHDQMFYVYNLDNNTFMAQGQTRRELESNLEARYPGKKFAARPENLKEVGF